MRFRTPALVRAVGALDESFAHSVFATWLKPACHLTALLIGLAPFTFGFTLTFLIQDGTGRARLFDTLASRALPAFAGFVAWFIVFIRYALPLASFVSQSIARTAVDVPWSHEFERHPRWIYLADPTRHPGRGRFTLDKVTAHP